MVQRRIIFLCFVVEYVKKRWNNMRGIFLDNDRKLRESKRNDSGFAQIFKPRWPLYSKLQLLKKTISSAQSLSNFSLSVSAAQHLSFQPQLQSREDSDIRIPVILFGISTHSV